MSNQSSKKNEKLSNQTQSVAGIPSSSSSNSSIDVNDLVNAFGTALIKGDNELLKGSIEKISQYEKLPDFVNKFYSILSDFMNPENIPSDKSYSDLSKKDTLKDVWESLKSEAVRFGKRKSDEVYYNSKTKAGDNAKFAYRTASTLGAAALAAYLLSQVGAGTAATAGAGAAGAGLARNAGRTVVQNILKKNGIQAIKNVKFPNQQNFQTLTDTVSNLGSKLGSFVKGVGRNLSRTGAKAVDTVKQKIKDAGSYFRGKSKGKSNENNYPENPNNIPQNGRNLNKIINNPAPADTPIYPQYSQEELAFLYKYHSAFGEHFDEEKLMMSDETVNSPVYQEMKRLSQYNFSPLAPNAYVATTRINLDNFYDGQISARDVMQDEVAKARINDKSLKEAINDLFASEEYKSAPDYHPDYMQDSKVSMLDFLMTRYNNCAKAQLMRSQNNFRNAQGLTLNQEDMRIFNIETQKHLKQRISRGKEILRIMNG